jgi:hypothetical protein
VLGAGCVLAVAIALAWRLRVTSVQASTRVAHATVPGVPPKHLEPQPRRRDEAGVRGA